MTSGGKLATPTQRQGRRGTSPKLLLGLTFEGRAASLGGPVQHVTRLRVATLVDGWRPCAGQYSSPRWWFEAHHTIKRSKCGSCFLEARRLRMSPKQLRCNVGMSGVDHWEAICPTGPMSCNSGTPSTAESQPSETQWECESVCNNVGTLVEFQLKDVPQASPQACIVRSGKLLHHGRSEGPQIIARPRRSTVDQKHNHTHWRSLTEGILLSNTSCSLHTASN